MSFQERLRGFIGLPTIEPNQKRIDRESTRMNERIRNAEVIEAALNAGEGGSVWRFLAKRSLRATRRIIERHQITMPPRRLGR